MREPTSDVLSQEGVEERLTWCTRGRKARDKAGASHDDDDGGALEQLVVGLRHDAMVTVFGEVAEEEAGVYGFAGLVGLDWVGGRSGGQAIGVDVLEEDGVSAWPSPATPGATGHAPRALMAAGHRRAVMPLCHLGVP